MPNHQISAALILEERAARSMLERLGQPVPLGNPVLELLAIAAEARSWLEVLRERVTELEDFTTDDIIGVEREKALVGLYERALDRTGNMLAGLVKLNLEARRVNLEEAQIEMMFRVMSSGLTAVPKQYRDAARQKLVEALRDEDRSV